MTHAQARAKERCGVDLTEEEFRALNYLRIQENESDLFDPFYDDLPYGGLLQLKEILD